MYEKRVRKRTIKKKRCDTKQSQKNIMKMIKKINRASKK